MSQRTTFIVCPAGEQLTYHYTNEEDGLDTASLLDQLRVSACALKSTVHNRDRNGASKRWEHEARP